MDDGDLLHRIERRAGRLPLRFGRRNLAVLAVRSVRRFIDVRVTGLAAEMTYFAVLSVVPLLGAIGAGFGLLERFVSEQRITELEDALIDAMGRVFTSEVVDDVVTPLVRELLRQDRTGFAIGGLLASVWLGSRAFRAAIRALDDAYAVDDRRNFVTQWALSLVFTAGSLLVLTVTLSLLVVGPLLGGGRQLAEWVGLGAEFEVVWAYGRWPLLAVLLVSFLTAMYRVVPNVSNTWRQCVPGAVVASIALVLVVIGFRMYLEVAGPQIPDVATGDEGVLVAAQLLGVLAAVLLFMWLSSIALLLGGVVNAEWAEASPVGGPRLGHAPPPDPAEADQGTGAADSGSTPAGGAEGRDGASPPSRSRSSVRASSEASSSPGTGSSGRKANPPASGSG